MQRFTLCYSHSYIHWRWTNFEWSEIEMYVWIKICWATFTYILGEVRWSLPWFSSQNVSIPGIFVHTMATSGETVAKQIHDPLPWKEVLTHGNGRCRDQVTHFLQQSIWWIHTSGPRWKRQGCATLWSRSNNYASGLKLVMEIRRFRPTYVHAFLFLIDLTVIVLISLKGA